MNGFQWFNIWLLTFKLHRLQEKSGWGHCLFFRVSGPFSRGGPCLHSHTFSVLSICPLSYRDPTLVLSVTYPLVLFRTNFLETRPVPHPPPLFHSSSNLTNLGSFFQWTCHTTRLSGIEQGPSFGRFRSWKDWGIRSVPSPGVVKSEVGVLWVLGVDIMDNGFSGNYSISLKIRR